MNDGKNWFDRYGMILALFFGLVIIAGAIYFGHGAQPQQGNNDQQGNTVAVDITKVKTAGQPVVGNANAPVVMAVFFDYQCPFCQQLDQSVISKIYTNYVQTGKVKIVFKDFDFIGPDSLVASEYSRAVWDLYPDKFYAWNTAMFAAQDEENANFGDEPSIKKLTATIQGIDAAKVSALVAKNKAQYDADVQANYQEGVSYGIRSTPSVILGKQLIVGANTTYEQYAAMLDAELKK